MAPKGHEFVCCLRADVSQLDLCRRAFVARQRLFLGPCVTKTCLASPPGSLSLHAPDAASQTCHQSACWFHPHCQAPAASAGPRQAPRAPARTAWTCCALRPQWLALMCRVGVSGCLMLFLRRVLMVRAGCRRVCSEGVRGAAPW